MPETERMNDVEAAKLAVSVEEIGAAFYNEIGQRTDANRVRRIVRMLAGQEEVHRKRFEALAASLAARSPEYWDDPTIEAYIRAIVHTGIFPDAAAAQALARSLETAADALRLALKVEKDSVLFYTTAAGTARSDAAAAAFGEISEEEKTHVQYVQSYLAKEGG